MARKTDDWLAMTADAWLIGAEMGMVIWLRSLRIALGGPLAEREIRRMFSEKFAANVDFGTQLITGGAGTSTEAISASALNHYGPKVRANHRRLSGR